MIFLSVLTSLGRCVRSIFTRQHYTMIPCICKGFMLFSCISQQLFLYRNTLRPVLKTGDCHDPSHFVDQDLQEAMRALGLLSQLQYQRRLEATGTGASQGASATSRIRSCPSTGFLKYSSCGL